MVSSVRFGAGARKLGPPLHRDVQGPARGGAQPERPRTVHRDGAPPELAVPTVFFATGTYFPGLLSIYNMLDHAYLL